MASFDSLLARGFRLLLATTNSPVLSRAGETAQCISTSIVQTSEQRDGGYWPRYGGTVEILRADFERLKIVDRSIIGYTPAGGKKCFLKVLGFDGALNDGDPCVRLTLKEEPGATAER